MPPGNEWDLPAAHSGSHQKKLSNRKHQNKGLANQLTEGTVAYVTGVRVLSTQIH